MSLDRDETHPAYRLGRLFAVYERVQRAALGAVNATIRDRYFGAASATPASVFPLLARKCAHHLTTLRRTDRRRRLAHWYEREIDAILDGLGTGFPRTLRLADQGRFILGYHHQRTWKRDAGQDSASVVGDDQADEARAMSAIRSMGRKYIVPYGLYRAHGYASAPLGRHEAKGTGFSEADLALLWTALERMFDHDRSASRGEMAARRLIVFRHESPLGNAPAHRLFERVRVSRVLDGETFGLDEPRARELPTARAYAAYAVEVNADDLPRGVELLDPI